jgi:DNA-binding winged helix-turn-helix (wHTH) protein/tetratricopeptide (TPR) repeat protein
VVSRYTFRVTRGDDKEFVTADSATLELRSDPVRVHVATRELEVAGERVSIERRAFDLLVHLMRNADRVVGKDELLREVWHSRPVSESTVAQAVSRVRRALGGEPDRWVATVYGVGYRFTGEVTMIDEPGATASSNESQKTVSPSSSTRWRWIAASVLVILLLAIALNRTLDPGPQDTEVRIAVLPVQNDTGDARLDWVELGVLPLLDRALEDGGVRRVETSQVLSTLRRYPDADDGEAQARVLRLNTRADRVLVPRLSLVDGGYRLDVRSADGSTDRYDMDFQGADVTVLAVAAGKTLSESLSRWQGAERAQRSLVTDDPFVNEAFARGLDARLRGQWKEAAQFFDTVLTAAPELLDAKYHLALVTRRLGDWEYTDQLHGELLEAAVAQGDIGMMAAVQSVSGTLAWRRGQLDLAEDMYSRALANYAEQGNPGYIANTMSNLGILAATRGQYATAQERILEALQHYQSVGDRYNEATALRNLGQLFVDQGRLDEGALRLEQSLEIRRSLELPLQVAMTLGAVADVDMARGHWLEALTKYERVLDAAREYNSPTLEAQAGADLSTALRRVGRLEEARRAAAAAVQVAVELGSVPNEAYALLQQGRAEHDLGHWQRASELFHQSRELYERIEQPIGAELSRIAQAEALTEIEALDDAAQLLESVVRAYEESEIERLGPGLARARARLAERSGEMDMAIAQQREAYRRAVSRESAIEQLDFGGQLGLLLVATDGDPDELHRLAEQLRPRAEVSASALQFLSRLYKERDPDEALAWAERRRSLIGEGWTSEDEREFQSLRTAVEGR